MLRLRTVYCKDIKKYDPAHENAAALRKPLEPLIQFIRDICAHCECNLYMDKAIEGSYPMFEVLKLIQDLFGGHEFRINKSKAFESVHFLDKTGLFQSRSFFFFLVNSLKSSWANVRQTSFGLLTRYSDTYPEFHTSEFVNGQLIPTALELLNDPRSMMAEACGLMLKVAFAKCIDVLDISRITFDSASAQLEPSTNHLSKRKQMIMQVFSIVKQRLATFTSSLVTEGKTTALIHGLICFFKHVFKDMEFDKSNQQAFEEWRELYHTLLSLCLEINRICASLLSNNRLTQEGKELVDCRGHPVE
jgi:hypothetical protein